MEKRSPSSAIPIVSLRKTSTLQIIEKLKALGVERHLLPENLAEFFGVFASERQNVIKAADIVRHSPLIGAELLSMACWWIPKPGNWIGW